MENNNCHFQVGSLVTANLSWQLALPISIGANFGHNPYSLIQLLVGKKNSPNQARFKVLMIGVGKLIDSSTFTLSQPMH